MVHGQKDEVVPVMYSRKVLKIFPKAEKKLLVIKNGDHSLSSKKNLNIIQNINTITTSPKNIIQSTNIIRNPIVDTVITVIIIATNPEEIIGITDIVSIAIIDNSLFT